jgi:hypothetical protein
MQKISAILCLFILGSLWGCGNGNKAEQEKREQQYAHLLEEEYDAFLTSERYNTFKQRYELLCDLTQRIDNDSAFITSENLTRTDSLCFIPTTNWDTIPREISFMTFDKYINQSAEVTAVIVYNWFDEKREHNDKFSNEFELHEAYEALDKEAYLKKCYAADSSSEWAYLSFCDARVYMDNLNHCKYFVILKTFEVNDHILLPHSEAGDYISGGYEGMMYVYNIAQQQMETVLGFTVGNSSTITMTNGRQVDETFRKDLRENLQKKMRSILDSAYGVKGDLPDFYLN